jgi:cytidyltransferase-like protein
MDTVVLISGGFDPIHSGHIAYIKEAKRLGKRLVIALNSDEWLSRKKGKPFMTFNERKEILSNLKEVDEVYAVNDEDGSVKEAILYCLKEFPSSYIKFVNGGDRTKSNIPEMDIVDQRLIFEFEIGGNTKLNSSSKILSEWKDPKTYRQWGYYRVLHSDGPETKTKELVVNPNSSLSFQRHKNRAEHWMISSGIANVILGESSENIKEYVLRKHSSIIIPKGWWHQLKNCTDDVLKIIEIQYGTLCIEEDIERN